MTGAMARIYYALEILKRLSLESKLDAGEQAIVDRAREAFRWLELPRPLYIIADKQDTRTIPVISIDWKSGFEHGEQALLRFATIDEICEWLTSSVQGPGGPWLLEETLSETEALFEDAERDSLAKRIGLPVRHRLYSSAEVPWEIQKWNTE